MNTTIRSREITPKTLWAFLAIAFGQAWGLAGLLFAFPEKMTALFGPVGYTNPMFVLAVYAPAFAGIGLVFRAYGLQGVGRYLRRLTLWRMPAGWWTLLLLGMPAVFYAGATLAGNFPAPFPFSPWYSVIPAVATALVIGPIEEFGWRGMALPLLQRRFTPLGASLVLGFIWAVWHVPAFFMSGTPQSGWSFGAFFLGVMALTVILTAMFNASKGSMLVAFIFHFMMNSPVWPDAQPWDSVILAVIAVAVVIFNRQAMLDRAAGVTEVLASAGTSPADTSQPSSTLYDDVTSGPVHTV